MAQSQGSWDPRVHEVHGLGNHAANLVQKQLRAAGLQGMMWTEHDQGCEEMTNNPRAEFHLLDAVAFQNCEPSWVCWGQAPRMNKVKFQHIRRRVLVVLRIRKSLVVEHFFSTCICELKFTATILYSYYQKKVPRSLISFKLITVAMMTGSFKSRAKMTR